MDRLKLAKVLGMLGSTHDGEVLNAARQAQSLVKNAGLTWEQAITVGAKTTPRNTGSALAENAKLRKEVAQLKRNQLELLRALTKG